MMQISRLTCLAVLGWMTLSAYGQVDPGDCGIRSGRCNPEGAACTASDGKSGVCREQRTGCECVPHNVCHLDATTKTYRGQTVAPKAIQSHLNHGDCLIDDGVDCTIDHCDLNEGCVNSPDNGRCDDGLFCTTETCTDEGCIAVSTCPPMIDGCVFVNDSCDEENDVCVDRPDHGQCDDSDICTSDACDSQTGNCVHEPLDCDDGNPCTIDECDPDTGCTHRAKCDDANLCTSDNCDPSTGQCINFAVGCFDMDPCTTPGICDPATGHCTFPPIDCDDEDPCTTDRCQGGTCVYDPVSCDDGDPCTNDFCDPDIGCTSAPKNCDDGNMCNGPEICSPTTGDCVLNPLIIVLPCIDNNVCTDNVCDPPTGTCSFPPRDCDDGNACTIGSCDPTVGCVHEDKVCDFACLGEECDPVTGGCGPVLPVGTACDDGDECTQNDSCFYGTCSGAPCSDAETCCAGTGCANLATDHNDCGACGNACGENSVCLNGVCGDGCLINGVAYGNGVRNPNDDCQVCDTAQSRTQWRFRLNEVCTKDCITGICQASLGGSGCQITSGSSFLCIDTPCATQACINNQCISSPRNEGTTCLVFVQGGDCRSSTSGVCQSGNCVGLPTNEGGNCSVNLVSTPCMVPGAGTCHSGACIGTPMESGTPCVPEPPYPLNPNFSISCYTEDEGTCNGSGQCVPNAIPLGSPCTPQPNDLCLIGTCTAIFLSGQSGSKCNAPTQKECERDEECGPPGECDSATGQCDFPVNGPSGEIPCPHGDAECCPGQVCICDVAAFCLLRFCYWPEDVPEFGHGP